MSVVATFTVSAAQVPLTEALPDDPDVGVRIERILDTDDGVTPVFWVEGHPGQIGQVSTNLARLDGTRDLTRIEEVDGQALYRMTWRDDTADLLSRFVGDTTTLLCARGDRDTCELVVEFADETALERFRTWFQSAHVQVTESDLHRVENASVDVDTEPSGSDLFIALTDGFPVNLGPSHRRAPRF